MLLILISVLFYAFSLWRLSRSARICGYFLSRSYGRSTTTAITVDTSARPPNAKLIAVCVCGYFVAISTPSAIALSSLDAS